MGTFLNTIGDIWGGGANINPIDQLVRTGGAVTGLISAHTPGIGMNSSQYGQFMNGVDPVYDQYGNKVVNNAMPNPTSGNANAGQNGASPISGNDVNSIYGGSAPNYAQINANTISQLQQGADTVNNSLARLPGQLDIANANINSQYGQKNNELQSGFDQTQNQYNTSTTQNQQSLRGNKNAINDQASQGLRGLMRTLGAYGAVGSDMGQAGQAVANLQSQQNAGAGQTYGQNQRSLDTNWGNYNDQYNGQKKQLQDWLSQNLNSAQSQSLTTKQDLLSKLADIQGQISAARGGAYSNSAQPYLDQANALSGQIDNLGKLNPTYDGKTPVYTAPTLGSYQVQNPAQIGVQGNGTSAADTPFLNLLLGKNDKNKQTVGA